MQTFTGDFGRGEALWRAFGAGDSKSLASENAPALHFASANGLPAASYDFFLEPLTEQYPVWAMENRGMWPGKPKPGFCWSDHADDLLAFWQSQSLSPVIAMGHSIGATCSVMAAVKNPDAVSKLVLIDPATLPNRLIAGAARRFPSLMSHTKLVKGTGNRRSEWPSREAFQQSMSGKAVYKRFTAEAMKAYGQHGLKGDDGGFMLSYAPEWEAHNFQYTDYLWKYLPKLRCPTLLLRAEHSFLHREPGFSRRSAKLPANITTATIDGLGHLAPQEGTETTLKVILDWLQNSE